MNQFRYLGAWLQCLEQLTPSTGLVHVGAGGSGQRYPFLGMPRLLAIDARTEQVSRLRVQLQSHADCRVIEAVLARESGEGVYYRMSQANESGLCSPGALQGLWPSITAVDVDKCLATTLQAQMEHVEDANAFNWVMIDCLPAGELLCGAGLLPRQWDVVVVRAVKDTPTDGDVLAMGLSEICRILKSHGLGIVTMEEENHPGVVRALFVRNQRDQFAQELSKLIAENVELTRARTEFCGQRDAEQRAKIAVLTQRDSLAREAASLTVARDELTALTEELQKTLSAQQQRIQELEVENRENAVRQQNLQDALVKAEVQIDLIKDLLLREPGL